MITREEPASHGEAQKDAPWFDGPDGSGWGERRVAKPIASAVRFGDGSLDRLLEVAGAEVGRDSEDPVGFVATFCGLFVKRRPTLRAKRAHILSLLA
jgi:hypothetical protein